MMVEVELQVVSSHRDGLLMALGEVLLANGFTLSRHRRANTASGVVMTLVAKGPEANLLRLEEQLGTHYMVESFEAGLHDRDKAPPPLSPPMAPAAPAKAAPAPALGTVAAAPDQGRVESMLPQVAREYPKIFGLLFTLEHSLEPARREATMHYVGTRVGAWVYKRDFALGAQQPLHDSIAHIALPALRQLLPTTQEEQALVVAHSPFATHDHGATTSRCHFLRGFLEGVLKAPGHLGEVRVAEPACRACGSESCRFEFHA